MTRFMLDTNIVSNVIHARSSLLDGRIGRHPSAAICISIVTYSETMFGLAKRPAATRLAKSADRLFKSFEILNFDLSAGTLYGKLRARLEQGGTPLSPLDMLIAAHALAVGATLVSADRAFRLVPNLPVEDWTA